MAVVYHAEHRQSRTPVALKVYAKHALSVVTRRQVDREIAIQGRLAHSNIIKLVRVTSASSCICRPCNASYSSAVIFIKLKQSLEPLQYGAFEDGEHVVLIEEYGAWVSAHCCPHFPDCSSLKLMHQRA